MGSKLTRCNLGLRFKSVASYSSTLQLPKTKFGPKVPSGAKREELIKICSENLYQEQLNRDSEPFILHDGPPYANGDLHLGHALNKITKDMINRFESLYNGKKVIFQPGWDCHGLPIEMKALDKLNMQTLTPAAIRRTCRELATSMIDKQRLQFKQFAIMTDFDNPYITMNHDYEIAQLRIFTKLLENGLLSRQLKPVWWGPETFTALAEAELEYKPDHKSVAVYLKFPLQDSSLLEELIGKKAKLNLLIWTSTPWTIPANKAICIHSDVDYTILTNSEEYLIVADSLAEKVLNLSPDFSKLDITFEGKILLNYKYFNPAAKDDLLHPILHGDHVTTTVGTGLVHTAPAHGMDDYHIGKNHGLVIESAVNNDSKYISNLSSGFQSLADMKVTKASTITKILEILTENGMVYHVNSRFKHSYPYDWRSKTPVIQRATPQWFINVEKIKDVAIEALKDVQFTPESGKNRLPLFIQNRNEWCISRQRSWGVPLPIIYNKQTDEPIEDLQTVKYIVEKINEFGTDEWFESEEDVSRWLPKEYANRGLEFFKGKDTMDVWFDSGTSWATIPEFKDKSPLADVYLEGSDQHRGWFQSSLLNKIVSSGTNGHDFKPIAPFKKIITHGFTLDKQNNKMSKSRGNVVSPTHVMEGGGKPLLPAMGTDGLRLWVASSDYTSDVNVTPEVLSRVFENFKKLRVTFKYILGNLNDYEFSNPIAYEDLNRLDKYTLSKLYKLQQKCLEHYQAYSFSRVINEINNNMSTELSALYFDISKDCLYTDKANSHRRRSIQTVLNQVLRTYIGLLAPIQPIMTQEVWQFYQELTGETHKSPFSVNFEYYQLPENYNNTEIEREFDIIWTIRDSIYSTVANDLHDSVKNKLELQINLNITGNKAHELQSHQKFLDDYFLVSKVSINEKLQSKLITQSITYKDTSIEIEIGKSSDSKCPRCWKYTAPSEEELCSKCNYALSETHPN